MALTAKQQEILGGATPQDMSSLSPEQQAMMGQFNQQAMTDLGSRDNVSAPDQTVEKAEFRSWAQGASLGIADEIEAMARTMASSRSYEEIRDEIRAKLNAYQKAHPGEALSYELLGAVAPTALAYIAPIPSSGPAATASTVGRTASWLQKAKPVVGIGAAEGFFSGYATGEDGVVEDLARAPLGGLIGAGGAGLTTALMGAGGTVIDKLINKTRQLFGDKASTAVGQELQRLVDASGFSPDEILQKIQAGEIIADNATLEATLRALRAEMPKGGKIDNTLSERAKSTKEIARGEMQEGMTPGVQGNVYRDYTVGDKAARKQEDKLYEEVWSTAEELTPEIVDTLADAIKKFPNAKDVLGEIYQARGSLVPFFKIGKNGEIKIVRMPTLKDAEIVRRSLGEEATAAFDARKGELGAALNDSQDILRKQLDAASPILKATRQNASNIRGARDAYTLGRNSLGNKGVEELEVEMERLIGTSPTIASDAKLKAFRAGAMVALKNKIKRTPTFLNKVAEDGTNENTLLRTIFPEDKIDDLIEKANIAGQSRTAKQRILYGSPTAPQEKAADLLGTGAIAARASQGDPIAQLALASALVKQMRPDMTPKQKDALVDLLLSEDPEFVRKALMNESGMAKLQQKINTLGSSLSRGVERGATFEAGREGGELDTGLLNLFTQ